MPLFNTIFKWKAKLGMGWHVKRAGGFPKSCIKQRVFSNINKLPEYRVSKKVYNLKYTSQPFKTELGGKL